MSLSNTTLTSLSSAPYNDDYYAQSDNDPSVTRGEDFDFHRILFRPARAVQARELTQLQTIIQTQIERHGKSAFRNGEAVYGGGLTLDTGAMSGQMTAEANLAAFFDRTTNVGKYVMKVTGGTGDPSVRAHVLQFVAADEGETPINYLVFKPQAAGTFAPGDTIQVVEDPGTTAIFGSGDAFSPASTFSIDDGVFFVSGFFVRVRKQTIVLDVASARPNCRIGLEIAEQVIDELDDVIGETLLDPANPGAPGAHRFRVRLTLAKRSLDSSADPYFIELARVVDGVLQRVKQTPRFVRIDELNQILARRTHDESGDYVVRTFTPVIETDPEDSSKFILAVGPGKAYVKGFEVETTEPTKLRLRKGRASAAVETREISTAVGNYVYAVRVAAGVSPTAYFGNNAIVSLHCANIAALNTTSETTFNYTKIGTARIRMIETHEVPNDPLLHANNSVYKLFFYDVTYDTVTGNLVSSSIVNNDVNLVLGIGAGVPSVNGALVGTTIVLAGAASPTSGTFTVKNYTANATHGTIVLNEMLPTLPNANTTYRVLYQAKDIDSFAKYSSGEVAGAPFRAKLSFQADVDIRSKLASDNATLGHAGDTVISETNKNTLLYQIPEMFVKANSITTNSAIFTSWGKTSNTTVTGGGTAAVTLSLSGAGATYTLPTGALTAAEASKHLLVFDFTPDANGSGRPLQFATTPGTAQCLTDCVVTDTGTAFSVAFNYRNAPAGSRYLIAFARTTIFGLTHRQKTLMLGNTTVTHTSTANSILNGQIEFYGLDVTPGAAYLLKTADVLRVTKVLYKDANTVFTDAELATATDVTSHFTLDTGQRDNAYEYSQLIVGPRASTVVKPTGRLFVIFDWFQHSGRGYCTIDSYLTNDNITKGLTYETVPSYTSAKYNRTISLRDVLDFRPVRATWTDATFIFPSTHTGMSESYDASDGNPYWMPVSDEEWIGSYEHYLSRIDNVGLGYDGVFRVIEGTDAVSATRPTDDSGALLLFQLHIPPYTLVNAAGVPESVSLKTFAYKRFTMQDLSKVENRVAHLEYYTALNCLERITRDEVVLDDSGNERFKNGILVDSFHGGDVGDVRRGDFTASIDQLNRELRPAFRTFVVQFAGDMVQGPGTTANVVTIGDMAIPTYSVVPFITQPLATRAVSVNPFDVASFYGHIKLSPAVDIWKDTSTKPAQTIDMGGPTSEIWAGSETPAFTVWGEWEQTWSGVTDVQMHRTYSTPPGWDPIRHAPGAMTEINFNDVTTSTVYERQGTSYEYVVTPSSQSLGNRVVDVSIVHHMRARDIVFSADGLKPNANLYAFFDGRNVDGYIQRANQLTLTPITTPTTEPFFVGQTLYVKKALTGNVATTLNSGTVTGTGTHFDFEVAVGEYVRIQKGVNWFDTAITARASNTSLTILPTANATFVDATIYTFTPVTVADVATRITGANTQYTLKVVRASRDADLDSVTPYTIIAGSLRPEKQVKDPGVTTVGATVIVPASPRANSATFNVDAAVCVSGVVRAWNAGAHTLQLDTDAPSTINVGTIIRFVAGPGAGTSGLVESYNAATQTVTLDSGLPGIVAGRTVYSIANLQSDGFIGVDVVIGRAGTVAGVFHLPGGQFATGTRQFRLTDSANNDLDDATTAAELGYQASGLSYTEQETTVTSRSLSLQRLGPQTESMVRDETTSAITSIAYVDPLAETFLVDAKQYPQGVFITSVDLCFAAKPAEDIPVILEIRNVVNGYPSSSQILPCVAGDGLAAVSLRPDQVNVSLTPSFDTSSFTRFNLPAPVHLMPGREYAIVLRSDAASYMVYTALLNDTVIGTADSIVSKQPYAGSFFKSQNASTWTAEQNEDMMFRINRAKWNASAAAPFKARFVARAIKPAADTVFDSFEFYPHDVQFSDVTSVVSTLDIRPASGDPAVRYLAPANELQPLRVRSRIAAAANVSSILPLTSTSRNVTSEISANSVDVMIDLTTTSPDVAPFVDMKKINMLGVEHHLNDMPVLESLLNITDRGARYLPNRLTGTVATSATSAVVTGTGTNFVDTLSVGDTVVIGGNVEIIVSTVTNATSFTATANVGVSRTANGYYTYGVKGANNAVAMTITSPGATSASGYVTVARDGQLDDIVVVDDGANFIITPNVAVAAPNTANADASFTLTQTQGVITSGSELSPSGGNALTRYITRPVVLAEGFDARDIIVMFDAVKPWSTTFHVYYKVLPGDAENARFDDQPWRLMTQETPVSTYSMTQNQFKEFKFVTPGGRALGGSDTTDSFRVFAIKVVMASTNPTDAPRIVNFRAIALDV
jgi:hypothetical protein